MNTLLNKLKKNKKSTILVCVSLAVVVCLAVFLIIFLCQGYSSFNGSQLNIDIDDPIEISEGLVITDIGDYNGLYLEDGSDDLVTDIMMIVLKNTSEDDLQLARISLQYKSFTAEFEATNLPSGESVVLLEKNRHGAVDVEYTDISVSDIVFFDKPMTLMNEAFKVSGDDGIVKLKNISDKDITGVTYVYYKNKAGNTYYGGITYRAKFEETISAGESVEILTSHFTKKNSEIIQVVHID